MSTDKKRPRRIADLLQRAIANALLREIKDPRLTQVSITAVDVSDDLRNAKIFFAIHDDTKRAEVESALEKATPFIRHTVAEQVDLRYVPKIFFVFDETLQRANNISHLLDEVLPDDDDSDDTKYV